MVDLLYVENSPLMGELKHVIEIAHSVPWVQTMFSDSGQRNLDSYSSKVVGVSHAEEFEADT